MIESTAHVGPEVRLGRGVYIGHGTIVDGHVVVGDDVWIGHHCVIGAPPSNAKLRWERSGTRSEGAIEIGARTVLREFSKIDHPIRSLTRVGADGYVMAYSYVAHDSLLDDHVI